MEEKFDVLIIGAGAAGLSAGIYTSRAKLSTVILNEGVVGGQMILTEEVANYPGVESTKGYTLANTMKVQAKSFGCKIKSNIKIVEYKLEGEVKTVTLEDGRTAKMGQLERPQGYFIDGKLAYVFFATADGEGGFHNADTTWNMPVKFE